jgi:site-specific DNA recombinase
LFFTPDGERYQPSYTRKANGKSYRYYVPIRKLRFGADTSEAGRVPAKPIEQLVLAQVHAVLKAPEAVQSVWDAVRVQHQEISEPEVVLQWREIGAVWARLFPEEQRRIVQLLIERVTLSDADIEITWRAAGWPTLVGDIFNGQQPKTLSIRWLKTNELPWEWEAQRVFFGKFDV